MAKVLALSGSLRKASLNAALLRAAAERAPQGTEVQIAALSGIPLYDGDVEARGLPQAVEELKERIATADALLIATPEYNNSLPGVLKNAIDWCSRPASDIARVFGNKPVALMGATPGMGGTRLAQAAWLPVLRTLGAQLWTGKQLYVAGANRVFDDAGSITDEKVEQLLVDFMASFSHFVAQRQKA